MSLDRIRIVLVRPREAQNVGAVARAMKNMGLGRLVLVDAPELDEARAATLAVHAGDVLAARTARRDASPRRSPTAVWSSARADARPPRATRPRRRVRSRRVMLAAAAVNDVALVFGPEDHGLALEELEALPPRADDPDLGRLRLAEPRAGGPGRRLRALDGAAAPAAPRARSPRTSAWSSCGRSSRRGSRR